MAESTPPATSAIQQYLDELLGEVRKRLEASPSERSKMKYRQDPMAGFERQRPLEVRTVERARPVGADVEVTVAWLLLHPAAVLDPQHRLVKALAADFRSPAGAKTVANIDKGHLTFKTTFASTVTSDDIHAWVDVTKSAIEDLASTANAAFEAHNRRVDELKTAGQTAISRANELNQQFKSTAPE